MLFCIYNSIEKSIFGGKRSFGSSNIHQIPINSKEYLNIDYKDIPEDEKFFYEYNLVNLLH
jgi:hypothetical protein